ncbi:hypothetical protein CLV78_102508 [Aliiruegeria haliotis]|uniref:Sulfotransferase family protein n=1 Tax=Aliiruegeria haliotis TaxID=1280846 RepID=A0A2T0RW01_9RHOB|nr:hypothetical protein CLV78_102508 [Aliiruegeria haliotis]
MHVGLPKTGSTAIQMFLATNRRALKRRGIACAPPLIDRYSQLEYGLAACLRADRLVEDEMFRNQHALTRPGDQADLVSALPTGRPECDREIISSEHIGIWLHTPELRAALDELLSERFAVFRYIMFVRPQAEFVLSSYSESVKRGSARSLQAFVEDYAELDIHQTILDWRAQFGARLRVAAMPGAGDSGPDLIDTFCAFAGIDPVGLQRPTPANEALSRRAAGVLRRANDVIGKDTERNTAQRAVFALVRKMTLAALSAGPRLHLSDAQRTIIAQRYPHAIDPLLDPLP